MTIPIIAKFRKAFVGTEGLMDATDVDNNSTNQTGVLNGTTNVQAALSRLDGTGIGASIFRFTGPYSAQSSNINEWFGGRQLTRLRCVSNGNISPVNFDLPGTAALNTAFDQLVTAGLPEVIRFVIEYTGTAATMLIIRPRAAPSPQIANTTSIIVRSGVAAEVEITRSSGTISDYTFLAIGGIGDTSGGALDAISLNNPANAVWDASASGSLPTSGVIKGSAYKVVNAPVDGSGRFGEVMQSGDWVVWEGETFTAWATEPHQWFVIPAHEVRRISALENDFLNSVVVTTPVSNRNTVIRGANYADTAPEIRLKVYPTVADYDAADLNTTGDIDEYTNASEQTGILAIRLAGTQSSLASVLPTLYVYSEDSSGNFERLFNLQRDFDFQGDFGSESDYTTTEQFTYNVGDTLRVYIGSVEDRYSTPDLDVYEGNLSDSLQGRINAREPWAGVAEVLFSGAVVRDIHVADRIEYTTGYSVGIDWRDMSQSTTINANRYLDNALSISVNLAAFTINGFGVGLQKLIGVQLQRNDAQTGDGALIETAIGVPFMRVNTSNQVQINTTAGNGENWQSFAGGVGPVTLGSGSNNLLLFEVLPRSGQGTLDYEVVGVLFDGTSYTQLNNINVTFGSAISGDNLGFSRSAAQRGQVLRFSAIRSSGYLTHSNLESLLRQHQNDRWNYGFARLFEGSTTKDVIFTTGLGLISPNGTQYGLSVDDSGTLITTEIT